MLERTAQITYYANDVVYLSGEQTSPHVRFVALEQRDIPRYLCRNVKALRIFWRMPTLRRQAWAFALHLGCLFLSRFRLHNHCRFNTKISVVSKLPTNG
jgi:hypothetical protein